MYGMEMPTAGFFRPIAGSYRIVCDQPSRSRRRGVCLGIAAAVSLFGATEAIAQRPNTGSHLRASAVEHADLGVMVQPILSLRAIGAPVLLADGRYEQRYQVIANIAFRLVSARNAANEVRCTAESREVALTEFDGTAGYHAELRIRSVDPAALDVRVTPRTRAVSALR